MNHTFENVKMHMQAHRRPSRPTILRVSAGAAFLLAAAFVCALSFTSLCANLDSPPEGVSTLALETAAATDVHAFDVCVEYNGKTYDCSVPGGCKAGEVVYALGLDVDGAFVLDPPAQTELNDGDTVRIRPCTVEVRTEDEEIPFETRFVQNSKLNVGVTRTVTEGRPGKQLVVYHDYYANGEFVSTERISETVISEPVQAVCAVGTKRADKPSGNAISTIAPADFRVDENGVPVKYKSCFEGVATAYYGGGKTATGVPAAVGYVAVDPKVIPYGTHLYITSLDGQYVYGYAIAADTGGFAKGGWADVDLYMNTREECVRFGKRDVRIYIL